MSTEKISTLSVDHAIRIAKIIATAPVERLLMITQLFHQASVDLEGLEELIENILMFRYCLITLFCRSPAFDIRNDWKFFH